MELFGWMFLPQFFMQFFRSSSISTLEEYTGLRLNIQSISLYVSAGLYVLCLVMGGLGMTAMAKKVGLKHSWISFLPFANTYYAGKLAGETRVFNQKMKRTGLYAALVEVFYVAFNVFSLVLWFLLMNPAYYKQEFSSDGTSWMPSFDISLMPTSLRWMATANTVCGYLSIVVEFLLIFFMCVLYYAFFRKYYARGPFLMTFLCAVLPLRGFVIFAVRNNTPVDYDAWMQQRMQAYAQRQQQMYGQGGYGGYSGGYNGGYNGGQNGYGQGGSAPADPFPDYGDAGDAGNPENFGNSGSSGGGSSSGGGNDDPFPGF